ncbi:hypothetical protein BDV28DRAFT_9237 [Aspergillus coremiiformis]|uniref:Yeast cell wall synthesis Kre9/Knh1-like N-terminal domain-containing protein n=1 Tax=Aspergillus coremiiformis TaxID=138285 RepID=A0A5N6Z2V2_9EURO|nr:hypothetical protein BDV28DRAFT_9237 [Aspergillus coremiiformis]
MNIFTSLLPVVICLTQVGIADAVAFTQWPNIIYAGEANTVRWIGDPDVPVTITLRKGASTNLGNVEVLTDNARGSTFTWTAREDLEDGSDYALQIKQDQDINYSGHITVAHSPGHEAPAPKGPPPDRDPNSPNFDTAPHESESGVAKGNNATTAAANTTAHNDRPSTGNNLTSSKSAVTAKIETGDASLRNLSPDLLLAVIAIFYLTY